MTKKDYVKIAAAFKETKVVGDARTDDAVFAAMGTWNALREEIAAICAIDNPRFDRARFYKACGMESNDA